MKIVRFFSLIVTIAVLISVSSCSSEGFLEKAEERTSGFQTNDPPSDFDLFNIFKDYPSIKDGWDKVQSFVFNQGMAALIGDTPTDQLKDVIGLLDDLIEKPSEPLFNTLSSMGDLIDRLRSQDTRDEENWGNIADSTLTSYYDDSLSFLDKLSNSNARFSENLMPVIAKLLQYINVVHGSELVDITNDLLYMLKENGPAYGSPLLETDGGDTDAQNIFNMLPLLQEALSKLLLRNDDYMGLTGLADQTGGADNTYLGDAVEGVDLLLPGLNAIAAQDSGVIPILSDTLLEVGRLMTKDANGKLIKSVLKELLVNLEKYYTVDGSVYSVNADYRQDSGGIYVDAELTNTVLELWPVLQLLMIKADKTDYAILKDDDDRSPLQVIAGALGKLGVAGVDFSTYTLEGSLKQMLENGASGEDRSAIDASYLERLLFTLAIASNFGYKASMNDDNEPAPNFDRGHGASTNGVLTLNDSMYSLRSSEFMTLDAYALALNKRTQQADFIGRSSDSFTNAQLADHKFYLGYDFPAFCLLPAKCAGDAGLPNGGNTAVTLTMTTDDVTTGENYKTYFPKVGNGIGELNTAAVMMGMIARICWEGEGPYYATAGSTTGSVNGISGTIYRRPDGRVYAVRTSGGTYYYPADGGNDADANSDGWRENAYTETLVSDYYLVRAGFSDYYCPPPVNSDNTMPSIYTGTTTGISSTTVTDTSKSWVTNDLIGTYLYMGGQNYLITGNTATQITISTATSLTSPQSYSVNKVPKYVMGAIGNDKYRLRDNDPDTGLTHTAAKQFILWEKVRSDYSGRACATQEEAMARNFQWLANEKKFAFIIPMWLATVGANAASYIVIEANGLTGLANATKGYDSADPTNPAKGNGYWVKRLDEGTGVLDATELARRGWAVNYGDSYEPGDARIMIFCREHVAVSVDLIWQNILGKGRVLPEIIAQNMEPVGRMVFLSDGPARGSMSTDMYSGDASDWTTSDSAWTDRSTLFPLVVAAVGELHKCSYYENGSGNNNYYYAGTDHKYPLRTVLAGMIPPLVKPWMRHITVPEGKRWVPRIKYHPDNNTTVEPDNYAYLSPAVIWDEDDTDGDGITDEWVQTGPTHAGIDMRPRTGIRTLVNVMTENDPGMHNGLIPLLMETNTLSRLMALLQRIDGGTVTQATKDKIFGGLEQVITAVKASKGDIIAKEEASTPAVYGDDSYTTVDYSNLGFLFNLRPTDCSVDTLLEEAVGYRDVVAGATLSTTGKGFVGFVNRRAAGSAANTFYETYRHLPDGHHWDWSNLYRMVDAMRSLLADDGPNGDTYYIMPEITSLLEKFLSRVTATDDELKGLRHTLGIIMATYNGTSWNPTTDLQTLLTNYLPDIMETFEGEYDDLMLVAYNLFKIDGIMPSIFYGFSTAYPWSVLIDDLYDMLHDPFFCDPAARPSIWIGENSLTELLIDMVDMIGQDWYTRMVFEGTGSYVSSVYALTNEESEFLEFNPYKTLGLILSPAGR